MYSSVKLKAVGNKPRIKSRLLWLLWYPASAIHLPLLWDHSFPWGLTIMVHQSTPGTGSFSRSWLSITTWHHSCKWMIKANFLGLYFLFPPFLSSVLLCLPGLQPSQGSTSLQLHTLNITDILHLSNLCQDSSTLHLYILGLSTHFRRTVS